MKSTYGVAIAGALLLSGACGGGGQGDPNPAPAAGAAGADGAGTAGADVGGSEAGGTAGSGTAAGGGAGAIGEGGAVTGESGAHAGGAYAGEGGAEAAGGATTTPPSSELPPNVIRPVRIDRIDLVFMIDNSISMSDKQAILRDAVPVLVNRLISPGCIDERGARVGQVGDDGLCATGLPEFQPVKDTHIAIVTSSLGGHGGQICDPALGGDPSQDDRARPLGLVRSALSNVGWDGTGFLAWDPDAANGNPRNDPAGTANATAFANEFQSMISAVGETGCGYESSLESWYRFLIDPAPPATVRATTNANGNPVETVTEGIDTTLLALRDRFLRPDSLVAIVMLSDENDCSIVDERQSWLVGLQTYNGAVFRMPRSTTVCDTNPDDPCCTSCAAAAPAGCSPDPVCENVADAFHSTLTDNLNLRCHQQKRRFGFDMLHPVERYVDGLTKTTIVDAAGKEHANPLYAGLQRDSSMIFLVGIVGVPWQDVSTRDSWDGAAPLEYLSYDALEADGRFEWMLPATPTTSPLDALMLETSMDRSTIQGVPQEHPGTGHAIAPSGPGASGGANPMNGRESSIADGSDLQFACIFPLSTPKTDCQNTDTTCDCRPADAPYNRPICNGATQTHAKAYPGTRQIQVLRGVGKANDNAVIASICPKVTDATRKNDPSYGYTPAISAIIERLRVGFARSCLAAELPACAGGSGCDSAEPGQVDCAVIESSIPQPGAACAPCTAGTGRETPSAASTRRAHAELEKLSYCGGSTGVACTDACLCQLVQHSGDELARCRSSTAPIADVAGFCYVDPAAEGDPSEQAAAEAVVAACPDEKRRLIRFTGVDYPAQSATMLLLCGGS